LIRAALAAVGACLIIAMVAALGRGAGKVNLKVRVWPEPVPHGPVRLRRRGAARPSSRSRGLMAQMSRAMTVFAFHLTRAVVSLAESGLNFAHRLVHLFLIVLLAFVNFIRSVVTLTIRYLAEVAKYWTWLLLVIVLSSFRVGWHSARMTILPIAAAVVAAAGVLTAAQLDLDYLSHGALIDAGALLAVGALTTVAICLLWSAWSGLKTGKAANASARNVRALVVSGLACQAIGGWLLGLPGTLGHGPIRVGWFTIVATIGFAAAFAWEYYSERSRSTGSDPTAASEGV
jgi:hypothetical protein